MHPIFDSNVSTSHIGHTSEVQRPSCLSIDLKETIMQKILPLILSLQFQPDSKIHVYLNHSIIYKKNESSIYISDINGI
jgi:hypothetical protein